MLAIDFINDSIPTLNEHTTINQALRWMENYRVSQLPIVSLHDEGYMGMLDEEVLLNNLMPDTATVKDILPNYTKVFVFSDTHFYAVVPLFSEHSIEVLPVVDMNKIYVGSISITDISEGISKIFGAQQQGAILTITHDAIQYSMHELSKLIESNNAKVITSFVMHDANNPAKLNITLKLDVPDLSFVVATLERFGYQVTGRFNDSATTNFEEERLNLLLKYLEL